MFKAWIKIGDYICEGVVYQIIMVGSKLGAVYRLNWENEWKVADLENVEPIKEDLK